ncbi:dolichyl-phosphate beta-glucosyltransferase isoform X2 [Atheta coriaria]|uniref:dolichyl-phosphate beta-glucosyltransferase isoform X2 n=1 Tax=Dalotia coriaria TaxID=877792 RepID=UPI0031F47650
MWAILKPILFYGSAFLFTGFLSMCIFLISTTQTYPAIKRSKKEKYFQDLSSNRDIAFPSINEPASINLSVIIPAYNEEERLGVMLEECIDYLNSRCKEIKDFKYEIIVVSDGSKDKTVQIANKYGKNLGSDKFRVLDLEVNRGKGGAVRLGMLSARGALLLFADADGATKFADLSKLEAAMEGMINCNYLKDLKAIGSQEAISIGSRAHLEEAAVATRSFFRTILMYGFQFLVKLFAVRGLRDTQCGFKLMTREAARKCFISLHVERWAFDVEMLFIAQKLKIPITEVAVRWTEIDGSKITPFWSWLQMGIDLVLIWLRYLIGAWKISATNKHK